MSDSPLDVVGIGNAIVDVIAQADDAFLAEHGMTKGAMALVGSDEEADAIYAGMGPGIETSGGSAANTIAGLASFGGSAGYIGLVADDQLGKVFAHDITAIGVEYNTPALSDGPSTARCMVLVTPDGERTMNTFLGASATLGVEQIDEALISRAKVVYCEGYLWDRQAAKDGITRGMELAKANGAKVAFTLSDGFCVDRHRDEFLALLEHVDILFANESEILSLFSCDSFEAAVEQVRGRCEIACLTRSEKGSVVVTADREIAVPAAAVDQVLDCTGAGDLYAAGFLYGYTQGHDLELAARLGHMAAAEVISHYGARPEHSLAKLAEPLLVEPAGA